MRSLFLLALLALALATPGPAGAVQAPKPQFRSFLNGFTCGRIVAGLDNEATRRAYELMVGSFISGSNYVKNRDSKTDLKGMLLLTEQFCRQNPGVPVTTAMIFLDRTIDKRISVETR